MRKKEFVCIVCPKGCRLTAEISGKASVRITGYSCKNGKEYGRAEAVHPVRSVTSTVRVEGGARPLVPVKTAKEVPKEKIFECMDAIRRLTVKAPVQIGQILLKNIAGTGTDLIATGNIKEIEWKKWQKDG